MCSAVVDVKWSTLVDVSVDRVGSDCVKEWLAVYSDSLALALALTLWLSDSSSDSLVLALALWLALWLIL